MTGVNICARSHRSPWPPANPGRTRPPEKTASVPNGTALSSSMRPWSRSPSSISRRAHGSTSKARTRPANTPIAKASSDSPPRWCSPDSARRSCCATGPHQVDAHRRLTAKRKAKARKPRRRSLISTTRYRSDHGTEPIQYQLEAPTFWCRVR